jgi:AcrR family transcriptional regulator
MTVTRQPLPTDGRVNQKRRTRAAIVAAAQRLLDAGETPTVARAAQDAMVSRTTAYRYFPTQESLLLELAVAVPEVEALVSRPLDGGVDEVQARLLEIFDHFNRHVLDEETLYRRALRAYLDLSLAARGDDASPVREGRRARWIAESLAPLRGALPAARRRKLEAALCLVAGVEAMVVMRDVCGLERDDALAATRWAAEALLAAGLGEPAPQASNAARAPRAAPARRQKS